MRKFHTSRWKYWPGYFVVVLFLAVLVWAIVSSNFGIVVLLLALALVVLLVIEVYVHRVRVVISKHDIAMHVGVLSKKVVRVHFSNISDVSIEQSFLERLFNVGTVRVNTSGTDQTEMTIKHVSSPGKIERTIAEQLHRHKMLKNDSKKGNGHGN